MHNVINDQPGHQPIPEHMQEPMATVDCSELTINITLGALVGLTCSVVWAGNVMSHVATGMCAGACATGVPRTARIFSQRIIDVEPRPERELRPEEEPIPEGELIAEEEPRPVDEPELIGAAFGPNALDVPHDDLRRRGIQP